MNMTDKSFTDKVVIVTGASSGIGRDTAIAFAKQGAVVITVARREELLKQLTEELQAFSPRSTYLCGDLGNKDFSHKIIDKTVQDFGRLDILVNNAAIPMHRFLYNISVEDAEQVFQVNFLSCLWTCFAAIPYMMKQGSGTLVNISSFASKVPPTHETIYVASKAALNGFTQGLWNDLKGSGIHAVLLHPGPIDTEIWDKLDDPGAYDGALYPPSLVADEILRAVKKKTFEVVVPRKSFQLILARVMSVLAPSLVRKGIAKMDPIKEVELNQVKQVLANAELDKNPVRMGSFKR